MTVVLSPCCSTHLNCFDSSPFAIGFASDIFISSSSLVRSQFLEDAVPVRACNAARRTYDRFPSCRERRHRLRWQHIAFCWRGGRASSSCVEFSLWEGAGGWAFSTLRSSLLSCRHCFQFIPFLRLFPIISLPSNRLAILQFWRSQWFLHSGCCLCYCCPFLAPESALIILADPRHHHFSALRFLPFSRSLLSVTWLSIHILPACFGSHCDLRLVGFALLACTHCMPSSPGPT